MRLRTMAVVALLGLTACSEAGDAAESASPTTTARPSAAAAAWEVVTTDVAVPRDVAPLPDGRLLVSDQVGVITVIEADGSARATPMLDLAGKLLQPSAQRRENGLNGVALAPDFTTSGVFYTWLSAPRRAKDPEEIRRVDTLTRWRADVATLITDPESADVLLEVPQTHPDHVGDMVFGQDGLLYIGVGAGGGDAAAQDPRDLPGSIIRLKVGATGPYTIPEGNPFDGTDGRREIWSVGYRNPFRLHHDAELGLIVSEPMFREKDQQVSVATAGANAGYPALPTQARTCWTGQTLAPECGKGSKGFVPPVLEYSPSLGVIVSGAVRTRGGVGGLPDGSVLVADWEGGFLTATPGTPPWSSAPVELPLPTEHASATVWAVRATTDGNVYALVTGDGVSTGAVLRLRAR